MFLNFIWCSTHPFKPPIWYAIKKGFTEIALLLIQDDDFDGHIVVNLGKYNISIIYSLICLNLRARLKDLKLYTVLSKNVIRF